MVDPAALPEYRELYYQWENHQWEAGTIDLTVDRDQWQSQPLDLRDSFLWWLSTFYAGEAEVTDSLVPFVDAAPTEEQGVFLTTQLVDQARQTVFFDRFFAEVVETADSDMEGRVERQARRLDPSQERLLHDQLPAVAGRIRDEGYALRALIEGVTLYHLLIEGTLGLTGHRYLRDFATSRDIFPGFRRGLTAIERDTERHVSFGTRFLKDAVEQGGAHRATIESVLERSLPLTLRSFDPTGAGAGHFEPLVLDPEAMSSSALGSLRARLQVIGVELPA